jgi:hypothetical protein
MTETPHPGSTPTPESSSAPSANGPEPVAPDEVRTGAIAAPDDDHEEAVTSPAKVMRIGSMVKQLLEEVRSAPLDEASRERLAEIYDRSVTELAGALSPDLREELQSLALPFEEGEVPSESELRVAKAQLVGWLEGLFHGIQATLMAQQFAARQQLQEMRQLPGAPQGPGNPPPGGDRPGTYL